MYLKDKTIKISRQEAVELIKEELEDQGYTVMQVFAHNNGYNVEISKTHQCPICEKFYETRERAIECFRACSGINQ